jgi:hypothetical protein
MSGPEASRPYIEGANPSHPSLLDATHQMDSLFGVVNIPNVVWIDEAGMIVRPAEAGWPGGSSSTPANMAGSLPRTVRKKPRDPDAPRPAAGQMSAIASGQDRDGYPDAIRDWVEKGASSEFALTPDEVIARSQPRPMAMSEGAAHFELANRLWQDGKRDLAIAHFNDCHRLQPENWTYKRQAWSLIGNERVGGEFGRFVQGPLEGEEADWPFESDFRSDVSALGEGQYYPKTM